MNHTSSKNPQIQKLLEKCHELLANKEIVLSWIPIHTGCPKRYETFLNLNKRVQPLSLANLNVLKYKRVCENFISRHC